VTIRLVLADDHPIFLAGLAQLCATEPDFEVVARASNGDQALDAVRRLAPDILVLDIRMPGKDGLAVLRELKRAAPNTKAVVLTAANSELLVQAVEEGARGVVLKDMAPEFLTRALRAVHAGGTWLERGVAGEAVDRLMHRSGGSDDRLRALTPRETEVARLVAQGLPSKSVAEKLGITEGTAKLHLHHVYEKLGLDGRMALVRLLQGRGLG
jgi:DNA-binding NarL/FixJ family response regulator